MKSKVDVREAPKTTLDTQRTAVIPPPLARAIEPVSRFISRAMNSRPIYLLLCALAAAFTIGVAINQRFTPYSGGDLAYFSERAREILAHQDPYASVVAGLRAQGSAYPDIFFYDPFFYLLISPLALLGASAGWTIWAMLNGVFLLTGCAALTNAIRPSAPLLAGLLLADGVALTSMARFELYYGNVDVLLLCLLSCAFLAARRDRPVLAGILLALSGAFYIQSLPFVLFYLWKREYRIAAIGFLGWLLLAGGSFLLVPASSLGNFLTMSGYFIGGWSANFINQSLYAVFMRLFDPIAGKAIALLALPWLPALIWVGGSAAALIITSRVIRRRPIRQEESVRAGLEFALAVAALALIFPVLESNTLIISGLIMSALALAIMVYGYPRQWRIVGGALVVVYVITCFPLIKLMNFGQRDGLWGIALLINTLVSAPYLYVTFALATLTYVALTTVASAGKRGSQTHGGKSRSTGKGALPARKM